MFSFVSPGRTCKIGYRHYEIYKNPAFSVLICLTAVTGLIFTFAFSPKPKVNADDIKRCLIVSDIHFSPIFGSTDSSLKRKLITSSFAEWKKLFESTPTQMALDASMLRKDANFAVLQSAIINMKRTLPHPAFIIIAGDFIWHNATLSDSTLKKKTIQFIAGMFKEVFPGVPIAPAMGNNDTYGADYALQDAKFLRDFADAWEPALPISSGDSLKAKGYYTCETGNLKLVVINSALLNYKTAYPQAPGMLKWLQSDLADGGDKKVWIISHIPPGTNGYNNSNFWNPDYTSQFVKTIVKNSDKVKLLIASHTHFDDFKVVYNAAGKPVSYLRIVPSVCSNHGNNPSFDVAEYNDKTGGVIRETSHYLNLAAYPKGKSAAPDVNWAGTIDLPASLNLGEISATGFAKLINNIKGDKSGQVLNSYINFYNVGTAIDSTHTINHTNYLNYLKADSLQEKNFVNR